MKNIRFQYNGKTYEIPGDAYEQPEPVVVVLSESEAISLSGWYETNPPQPMNIRPISLFSMIEIRSAAALKLLISADYIANQVSGSEKSL